MLFETGLMRQCSFFCDNGHCWGYMYICNWKEFRTKAFNFTNSVNNKNLWLKKQIILQSATHGILHIGKMSSYQFHVNELCHLICLGFLKERGDGYIIMIFGKNINFNLIDSVELNVPRTVFTFCWLWAVSVAVWWTWSHN